MLIIDGAAADRTIASASGPLTPGTRFLQLNDANGIEPRQALVIGAETRLVAIFPFMIEVERSDSFVPDDLIFIGRNIRTVVITPATIGSTSIRVQSVDGIWPGDGILPGEEITITYKGDSVKVTVTGIQRFSNGAETVLTITPLPKNRIRGSVVTVGEGPFKVEGKAPGQLTLDKLVLGNHPPDRLVWKVGTELRAVIRRFGNKVEIDPLRNAHPFNAFGVENVRAGRIAHYSLGFGRGRLDAAEAVQAAKTFTHDERDLMIRDFPEDTGKAYGAAKQVESPDLWVHNDGSTPDGIPYSETPHQAPEVTIDPAIHIGTGPNDLEVSGSCTSAAEVTFEVEIESTLDHFQWTKNGGAPATGVLITAGTELNLSDGVKIKFASASGHIDKDRWIIKARKINNRYVHARIRNRGSLDFFLKSQFVVGDTSPNALDVARCRIMLCVSDGFPVSRYVSVEFAPGPNDLEVIAAYSGGLERSLLTIEIVLGPGPGDSFVWYLDGQKMPPVLMTANATHTLGGFMFRFASHLGHKPGDRWNLYARSGADAFLNVDHYWDDEVNTSAAPFGGRPETRVLYELGVNGLQAQASEIHRVLWPEELRPATNNPNATRPLPPHPRRFFLLGETVPHDGKLNGFTARTNNNISFRELVFAKFRFATTTGAALFTQLEVDPAGVSSPAVFRVEVRTTCGTFRTEKVRLRLTAKKGNQTETCLFRHNGVSWGLDLTPPWVTSVEAPKEALRPDGSLVAATGEQFDISFQCALALDRSYSEVTVDAEIVSDFRDYVSAKGTHAITVFEQVPLPLGTGAALAAVQPKPRSFVFTDAAQIAQSAQQAFGPVAGDAANRYRTTALFSAPTNVKAYAVTRGLVAIQRDPANSATVNVILRPMTQPVAGFTPIRYFLYRGIKLTDFLNAADPSMVRAQSGSLPFLDSVWKTFIAQNGNVAMPSTVFGYDPATQVPGDPLDGVFFRGESSMQLPIAQAGAELGTFDPNQFGFEIVLEEGGLTPTLEFARKPWHEVDVTNLQGFAKRLAQEQILSFLDPAAFYGLHMHEGGVVRAPLNAEHKGQDVYTNVVSKFFTKNRLTIDVRSENGSSLNFHGNYDVGGNQLGRAAAANDPLVPQLYAHQGWPIVVVDNSAAASTTEDFNEVFLQFPRNDDQEPVLYAAHGQLRTPATNGAFVRGDQLNTQGDWTQTVGFRFPNTTNKSGVAWILRLFYGRLGAEASYADGVFGSIDRVPKWAGNAPIQWTVTQGGRYVDGPGWRQMMRSGLAVQTSGRVLLYATATARDLDVDPAAPVEFAPLRGLPDGVSQKGSFFAEPGLFGVYRLEHDQIHDNATAVRTLRLTQRPQDGYAPASALLLGLSQDEFDRLVAAGGGITKDYLRSVVLEGKTAVEGADRYTLKVQGLTTANGEPATAPPTGNAIQVYTVDGQLFASQAFAEAEPLPTEYVRNYEEGFGTRDWPQRERKITSVNGQSITIANYDWRPEVKAGGKLSVIKTDASDGTYDVTSVTLSGDDTVIELSNGPGLTPGAAKGSALTLVQKVEDRMIDLDQAPDVQSIPKARTLVDAFESGLVSIANGASAKSDLAIQIDDQPAKLLQRLRELARTERPRAEDYERVLYWARLRMTVALKSHPFCLASISGRNELLAQFESKSRGYDVAFPAGNGQKVLLLGFDPFELHKNIEKSNPAGAAALALHNHPVSKGGQNALIHSLILPVRYRELDAGLIEDLVDPLMSGQVAMILGLGENPYPVFDLDRLAGRRRLGYYDNERAAQAPERLGDDATHAEFCESTLPASQLVVAGAAQKVFFNQAYQTDSKSFDRASDPNAAAGSNTNVPAFPLGSVTGKAVQGSGGAYLPNELFYRIARRRQSSSAKPPTGHFHIPSPAAAKVGIADVIAEVEKLIERWLDSLP